MLMSIQGPRETTSVAPWRLPLRRSGGHVDPSAQELTTSALEDHTQCPRASLAAAYPNHACCSIFAAMRTEQNCPIEIQVKGAHADQTDSRPATILFLVLHFFALPLALLPSWHHQSVLA